MPAIRTDDGVTLSYRASGSGETVLVFMHGWAGSCAYFDETLAHLNTDDVRILAIDLRGHGASDKCLHGYELDRLADDVWTVLDHEAAARVVLIGFSMSGKFAQYVAACRPQRVAGVMVIAGFPAGVIPFPSEIIHDWAGRAGDRQRLREVVAPFITMPVPPEVLDRYLDQAAAVPLQALEGTLQTCVASSFAERTEQLTMPVLVVGGRHDPVFPPEAARATARSLPCARAVIVDANHEIPMERPAELAQLIEAFVAGVGVGCPARG